MPGMQGMPAQHRISADVDGHAIVVVASPAACGIKCAAPGDHGSRGHELVDDLAADVSQPSQGFLRVVADAVKDPLVQYTSPLSPRPLSGPLGWGPVTNPSRDIDMYSTVDDIIRSLLRFRQRHSFARFS